MDITILAGGRGTRLKGIWDRPKCLVPYQGRPLIEHLVDRALELKPRKVFLLLGHKAWEVVQWREHCCPHRDVVPIIETEPKGTAAAVRNALPLMKPPLLVLNGDTLPCYNLLSEFVIAFDDGTGRTIAAWADGVPAGASLFGAYKMSSIGASCANDLTDFIYGTDVKHVSVSGFIDAGTPKGLKQLRRYKFCTPLV